MGKVGRSMACAAVALLVLTVAQGCSSQGEPATGAAGSDDGDFRRLAGEVLEFYYRQDPSTATYLGIHKYDNLIADYSSASVKADVEAIKSFKTKLDAVDSQALSSEAQLDLVQTKNTLDGMLLRNEVIRPLAKDPDIYSSGITNDAYVMISRTFAPPEQRLKSLTARMKLMPGALAEARKNLDNPPRVYTEIAIDQVDGNRDFFADDVPAAFKGVKDPAVLAEFNTAKDAVIAALEDYKSWLQDDLLNRSNGSFAYGTDTYKKVLAADEMITTPLPDLLSAAEADLKSNQQAFTEAARRVDPTKTPPEVLADVAKDFPPPSELLAVTQSGLDSLARFVRDKQIIDLPQAPPAKVVETPPFMRATTSAAMDTPGPFEKVATEAYFMMTLPDPTSSKEEQDVVRSYQLGVNAYVVKPVDFTEFVRAIADLGIFWAVLNEPPPGSQRYIKPNK